MTKRKVIIDCDPGHDDILAILSCLAHPESIEILGYTTVCGNNLVDKVTDNLLRVLSHLGIKADVAKGYDRAIMLKPEPQDAHGKSGLDGPILKEANFKAIDDKAINFMYKKLNESNDKVTIIALGPLTNIALLLLTYPEIKEKIECITIMGGSRFSGNIIERAEFNFYADPHAAKIVFDSEVKKILSTIEICNEVSIYHSDMDKLNKDKKASKLVLDLMDFYFGYSKDRGLDYSPIFDLVPVMHLLHPEIFISKNHPTYIVTDGEYTRGMSVIDETRNGGTTEVLISGNQDKFREYLIEDIKKLDEIYG